MTERSPLRMAALAPRPAARWESTSSTATFNRSGKRRPDMRLVAPCRLASWETEGRRRGGALPNLVATLTAAGEKSMLVGSEPRPGTPSPSRYAARRTDFRAR